MHATRMRTLILGGMLALLAGCSPVAAPAGAPSADATPPAPAEATAAPSAETDAPAVCPQPDDATQLVVNRGAGYCFLIPADYTTAEPVPGQITIFAPAATPGHRERAFINAEAAFGRSADAAAGAQAAEFAGFPITRTTAMLDQTEAVVLDNLPGQDLNRRVYVTNGDLLVQMMFMPIDPAMGEAYDQAETVYARLMESLRFFPPEAGALEYALLAWEGNILDECRVLHILNTGQARLGPCGDVLETKDYAGGPESEWAKILAHFGAFVADTPEGRIAVQGQGDATGPEWAEALAVWSQFTTMEINSGRIGAGGRTVLAWELHEAPGEPDTCAQLLVLAYGLAYANHFPCGGGQTETLAQAWLTTAEWQTLRDWLVNSMSIYVESGSYLGGEGSGEVDADAIDAWAAAVYDRIAP